MKRYDGCDVEPATSCPLEDAAGSAGRAFEPSTYYPLDDDDDDGSAGSAFEPTASDPLVAAAGSAGRAFEPSTYYPLDDDDDGSAGSALEPATSYLLDDDQNSVGGVGEDGNSQERTFDDSTPGGILVFFKIKDILSEVTVTHTKTDMGTHIDFNENFRSELIIPVESIASYSGSASVLIYDLHGRLKCTKRLRIDNSSSQAILDAECLPSSECFLRILGGKDVISARIECRK